MGQAIPESWVVVFDKNQTTPHLLSHITKIVMAFVLGFSNTESRAVAPGLEAKGAYCLISFFVEGLCFRRN